MASSTRGTIAGLPWRTASIYALLFVIALGLYAAAWPQAPLQDGDSPQYLEVARDLADFRLDALHDRTIGYPLLLALTGSIDHGTRWLLAVALVLHFVSIWLLAAVLHAAGVQARWLLLFGCLLLLPCYVEPAGYVMTENAAQFSLAAAFALLVLGYSRSNRLLLLLSGLAFGYAALTRPVYQALAVGLGGCLLVLPVAVRTPQFRFRASARAAGLLLAGWLLVIGIMASVNYAKFDYFGLVPSAGFHLCTKTMAFVERLPDEYATVREIFVRERDALLVQRGGTHTGTQTIWSIKPQLAAATGLSKADLSRYLLRMNLTLIRKAPIEYLQDVAKSMAVYWFPPAGTLATLGVSPLRWAWAAVHTILVGTLFLQIIVLVAGAACALSRRLAGSAEDARPWWGSATASQFLSYLLAGAIVFYTMFLTCFIDIGETRQRRPTDVLIVFMCFLGAHVWWRTISRSRTTPE